MDIFILPNIKLQFFYKISSDVYEPGLDYCRGLFKDGEMDAAVFT
jgi:hypothetical protein